MFEQIGTVCLFVNDQDKAKNFYVNTLGFELRSDISMGESRWLAVAPKGAATELVLYKIDSNWEHYRQVVGKSQPITFNVSNMPALHKALKAKGVRFILEPEAQAWGSQAIIADDEGNQVILIERPRSGA